MQEEEQKQVKLDPDSPVAIAITRALQEENTKFALIHSDTEFVALSKWIWNMRKVIQAFKDMLRASYMVYIDQVRELATSNPELLKTDHTLAIKELEQCVAFYQRELDVGKDIRSEYLTYVFSGHIIDTLIGKYRSEEDEYDYREIWHGTKKK